MVSVVDNAVLKGDQTARANISEHPGAFRLAH